jgi:hypothetical protein
MDIIKPDFSGQRSGITTKITNMVGKSINAFANSSLGRVTVLRLAQEGHIIFGILNPLYSHERKISQYPNFLLQDQQLFTVPYPLGWGM